jgi:hypothetical protein
VSISEEPKPNPPVHDTILDDNEEQANLKPAVPPEISVIRDMEAFQADLRHVDEWKELERKVALENSKPKRAT